MISQRLQILDQILPLIGREPESEVLIVVRDHRVEIREGDVFEFGGARCDRITAALLRRLDAAYE